MPHLGAAYNLARWLTRNEHDADDLVQEAYLRAFRSFDGYRGGDPRAWMLRIVRNACYTWLAGRRNDPAHAPAVDDPDELEDDAAGGPEAATIRASDALAVQRALTALPAEFREVVVLRELEDCSYKEIAEIVGVPLGTVMSRLSRGRKQLVTLLGRPGGGER
jgi:RNA polymerase sigma-70 factor (ECF subfamily)